MRRGFWILVCAGGLIFQAAGALAESWSIVEGRIAVNGKKQSLSGAFDASAFEPDPPDGDTPVVMSLDDFALQAGRRELGPRIPVEYDGLLPVAWLQLADQIHLEGNQVTAVHVRIGGKLVEESDEEVTFRFLELRADAGDGGYAIGRLGDTELPRRLVLKGDVYEVEQSFGLPGASCGTAPPPPVSGGTPGSGDGSSGGVIVIGSESAALVVNQFGTFDVASFGRRTFVWQAPTGSAVIQGRTTGDSPSAIEGSLVTSSATLTPVSMRFDTVRYYSLALDGPPSLDALGIVAPDGAEVSADANGALRIASTGDLLVEGEFPGFPISDLTSVTLSTSGRLVVTGRIRLPDGVSLRLEANEIDIDADGLETPPVEDVVVVPPPTSVGLPDFCQGLRPFRLADERHVGRFSLVASAARQVQIDVRLDPKQKRIIPGSDQRIRAAVFGSRSLDVHDIDGDSLRLGSGEAESLDPGVRLFAPVNGDRYRDLVAFFRVRDAEIAFGDREVCLVAETLGGDLLEGCDEIDVKPVQPPPR